MPTVARVLTLILAPLTALAAGAGLLVPGLYRDGAWVVPQTRGQDVVSLLAVAALLAAVSAERRGSARARLVWIGLLAYVAYTYTGAAFAFELNPLFPVYIAIFSLSLFALVSAARGLDPAPLAAAGVPRRATIGTLVALAVLLCLLWLGQLVPFLLHGTIPEGVRLSGGGILFVYVLDLGVVVPTALLAAAWLRRRDPWGLVLAGCILVKMATMGLALLAMTFFSARAGIPVEPGLAAAWIAIAAAGLAMSAWFFSRIPPTPA
jgi:hypothetical protein